MANYILNGRKVTQEEWDAHSKERAAFLEEIGCGLQAMFDSGVAPSSRGTDSDFWRGRFRQFDNDPVVMAWYRKQAETRGVSTTGKTYLNGLARFPGDPEAWVSDMHDVQARCRERGWGMDGEGIKVKREDRIEKDPEPVKLADDIVEETVVEYLEKDPSLRTKPIQELKEMVIDKHGPRT